MRTLVLFIVLGISTPAMAFEGEIEAKGVGEAGTGLAAMKILVSKSGDVSMEITAKDSYGAPKKVGYLNPAKGKYNYMLEHSNKTAIKMPKKMYDKTTESSQVNKVVENQNVEIKKLGKEKIAGHMTRHIQVIDKDTGGVSDMWLSDKYSAQLWSRVFAFGSQGPTDQMKDWNQAAKKIGFKPGFIMKMVHKDQDGKEGGLEVTKLMEKKVGKVQVSLPADYDVKEMPIPPGEAGDSSMKVPTTREEAERMRDEWMKKMER